MARQHRLKW